MKRVAREVVANGLKFAYLEAGTEGDGPLALLLHGFPDTPHTWDEVGPRIAAKGYHVVAPFMRGYRPTEIPARDTTFDDLARDALGLIEAFGQKNAILIGHDWGAGAVYAAAAIGPEHISKAITLAIPHPAAIRKTPGKLWAGRHFLAYKLPGAAARFAANDFAGVRSIYARWSPDWNPSDEELAAVRDCFADPASLNAAFGYYRALSLFPAATSIAVPTVAFFGTGDPQAQRADFERAREMFTGGYEIEALPGGHFLHREHPTEFIDRLLSHL